MLFSQAIKEFNLWRGFRIKPNSLKGYDVELRLFCVFMRNCHIEDIKLRDVMTYFGLMKMLNWNPNTFYRKAFVIKKFFEFYEKQDFKVVNPELIPVPQMEVKLPRVATEEEYKKVLKVIPDNDHRHIRNKAVIKLLWDTGARIGEICALDIDDLNLKEHKALIKTEKAKYKRPFREIRWTAGTTAQIKKWLKKREWLLKLWKREDQNALFITVCANSFSLIGDRFTIRSAEGMLARYSKKAGVKTLNPHSFRHHKGREIRERGGDIYDVADFLGHSSIESSKIYVMLSDKAREERHKKLFGW